MFPVHKIICPFLFYFISISILVIEIYQLIDSKSTIEPSMSTQI